MKIRDVDEGIEHDKAGVLEGRVQEFHKVVMKMAIIAIPMRIHISPNSSLLSDDCRISIFRECCGAFC